MSAYVTVKTEYRDQEILIEALCEVGGWTREQVEVHTEPVQLHGYHGDLRAQRASIVVPRQFVGSSANDLGFLRQADGTFALQVSNFDREYTKGKFILEKLPQRYAVTAAAKKLKDKRYTVTEVKDKNGDIVLKAKRWAS